jgi:hypothetical protein
MVEVMIEAYLVVREEKHIDDKHWVCLSREDALRIARDVVAHWSKRYNGHGENLPHGRQTEEA